MNKREGLLLANVYDRSKHSPIGMFASEKLDGERCFWDGGVTTGEPARLVPWAFKPKDSEIATGLWTRNFKVVHAPMEWVEKLPRGIFLDGELFTERENFQQLMSIVRTEKNVNPFLWQKVKFCVFDQPSPYDVFMAGRMRIRGIDHYITPECLPYVQKKIPQIPAPMEFRNVVANLKRFENQVIWPLGQIEIVSEEQLKDLLGDIISEGGEGVMLREPKSKWFCKRSDMLLKVKEFYDSEARVIGYQEGKGRHEGRMGALKVQWTKSVEQKCFEIGGGFTDSEREWSYVKQNFPIDSIITFRYLNLSDSGIPSKASYHRVRS